MKLNNRALLTAVSFIAFMATGVINPVNSLYLASLGANYTVIGLLGTVASATAIVLSYVWGRASDLMGRRKMFLLTGLFALAVTNALIAIVPSYVYIFPLRVVGGAALSAYATSSLALMGDELEKHRTTRGRRMGTFRGLSSLGFGLMAFFSGGIADRFSLRTPFVLSAIFYAAAFLLAFFVKEHRHVSTERSDRRFFSAGETGEGENDGTPALPLSPLLVSAFIWSLVVGAVYAVWANYMVTELGYTAKTMSRLWSLASTSEFPLMIAAGWLSDKVGRLRMLALGFLAWTLVFLGYVFVPGMPWIVFIQLTRGFAYSAFTAAAMTYAAEVRSRSHRGGISGAYSAAGGLGSILGAALGGIQTQLMGFRQMIGTNAALIFGGAVYLGGVMARLRRRETRRRT
jgi:MFS family permease